MQGHPPLPPPMPVRALALAYRRHEDWARRSGFAPMDWSEFKASRMANPLARAAIARVTWSAS